MDTQEFDGKKYKKVTGWGLSGSIAAAFEVITRDKDSWVPASRYNDLKEAMDDIKLDLRKKATGLPDNPWENVFNYSEGDDDGSLEKFLGVRTGGYVTDEEIDSLIQHLKNAPNIQEVNSLLPNSLSPEDMQWVASQLGIEDTAPIETTQTIEEYLSEHVDSEYVPTIMQYFSRVSKIEDVASILRQANIPAQEEDVQRIFNQLQSTATSLGLRKKSWDMGGQKSEDYHPGSNTGAGSGGYPHRTPKSISDMPRRNQDAEDTYFTPSLIERDFDEEHEGPIDRGSGPEAQSGGGGQSHSGEPGKIDNVYPEPSNKLRRSKDRPFRGLEYPQEFNTGYDTPYTERQFGNLGLRRQKLAMGLNPEGLEHVCAWCRRAFEYDVNNIGAPVGDVLSDEVYNTAVSHGICSECKNEQLGSSALNLRKVRGVISPNDEGEPDPIPDRNRNAALNMKAVDPNTDEETLWQMANENQGNIRLLPKILNNPNFVNEAYREQVELWFANMGPSNLERERDGVLHGNKDEMSLWNLAKSVHFQIAEKNDIDGNMQLLELIRNHPNLTNPEYQAQIDMWLKQGEGGVEEMAKRLHDGIMPSAPDLQDPNTSEETLLEHAGSVIEKYSERSDANPDGDRLAGNVAEPDAQMQRTESILSEILQHPNFTTPQHREYVEGWRDALREALGNYAQWEPENRVGDEQIDTAEPSREQTGTVSQMTAEEAKLLENTSSDEVWEMAQQGDPTAQSLIQKGIVASTLKMDKQAMSDWTDISDDVTLSRIPRQILSGLKNLDVIEPGALILNNNDLRRLYSQLTDKLPVLNPVRVQKKRRPIANVLDSVRDELDPAIWQEGPETGIPMLIPKIKVELAERFFSYLHRFGGYINPEFWVKNMFYMGSTATYTYNDSSDIDIHVIVDWHDMIELNPDKKRSTPEKMWSDLHDTFWWTLNKVKLVGTKHPVQYYVVRPGEEKEIVDQQEEIYDIGHDMWLIPPGKRTEVAELPEEVLQVATTTSSEVMSRIDQQISDARKNLIDYALLTELVTAKNAKNVYQELALKVRKIDQSLKELKEEYSALKLKRRDAFTDNTVDSNFSLDNVIFKFVERYKYMDVLRKIKRLTDDMDLSPDQVPDLAKIFGLKELFEQETE